MKRLIAFLLVLCLALALTVAAFAAGAPKISRQPESATTNSKGTVSFSIKATNFRGLTWRFVNPATGEEITGKNLTSVFRKLKVTGTNKQTITLKNVPDEMHGWTVYAHLTGNGYEVDSDRVQLLVYGKEAPSASVSGSVAGSASEPASASDSRPASGGDKASAPAPAEKAGASQGGTFTVRAGENVTLYPLDAEGSIEEDRASAELTFTEKSDLAVMAPSPVRHWIINGMYLEPMNNSMSGFYLRDVTSDLTISAALYRSQVVSLAEGEGVLVTCSGCSFSFSGGGMQSYTECRVPAGTSITVIADSREAAAGGYSINGGEYERMGRTSFRLTVTEDTAIQTK